MANPKGNILVIDDEAEICEGLETLLASEGFAVRTAGDAASGLEKLSEQPFDLLLLDINLPGRNGLELLQELRRRDPYLPIIVITAYGAVDMARAAFKAGAMDYLTKPWNNEDLMAQVYQALEKRDRKSVV